MSTFLHIFPYTSDTNIHTHSYDTIVHLLYILFIENYCKGDISKSKMRFVLF